MALDSNAVCSLAELRRFMSPIYADAASDNDQDLVADTDVQEDAINWATYEIQNYATMYSNASLASNSLVTRWGVVLSACNLAQTRGNGIPAPWAAERDRIYALLERLMTGEFKLKGVALSEDFRPTMSNLTIDRRYRRSVVRVTTPNSSDPPTKLTQDVENDWPHPE